MPISGIDKEQLSRAAAAQGNTVQAAEYFRQAAEKAERIGMDSPHIIQVWRDCAEQFYLAFKFSDSIHAAEKALAWAIKTNNQREECRTRLQISHILQNIGDLRNSLEEIQLGYTIAEKLVDEKLMVMVKLMWGNYYRHTEDPEPALEKYREVLAYHERVEDKLSIGGACLNLGTIYEMTKDAKNTEFYYRRALGIFKELHQQALVVKAQFFLGAMLEGSGTSPNEGIAMLQEGLAGSRTLSLTYEEFGIRLQLGDIYERNGDDTRAEEEFLKAKSLASGESSVQDSRTILLRLAGIEERRGNIQRALEYHKQYTEIILQYEQEGQKRRAVEREIQLHRLDERRKNELLERELQSKLRLNEAAAFYAREREQFLSTLDKRLERIGNSVSKKSLALIHNLQSEIKEMVNSGKDWTDFEQGFLAAHSEFEQKLFAQFPTLTTTERKVCILLRAGRSTKEIARLLHISPDTADTHRTHIRKKLGLQSGQSITSALAGL
jgi:DNA-binding CsgD family transcriptional regulator